MNVGVLLSKAPPQSGGGYTFEHDLVDALLRLANTSRHVFHLFAPSGWTGWPAASDHLQVIPLAGRVRRMAQVRAGLRHLRDLTTRAGWRRRRYGLSTNWREQVLLASGVDLVWYLTPGAAALAIPYITVVWDLQHRLQPYFPEVSAETEWPKRERMYAQVLRRATAVIAGTQAGKAEIERFYHVPSERIRILPHPTPQFAFAEPAAPERVLRRYGISAGYLFYPAQFWPHKNHAGLLQAVARLRDQYGLKLPLVLVGSDKGNGPYVQRVIRELDLQSQVSWLGFVDQDDLPALYRQALATTYVTYFGPENLPPLEAFAAGCPVVASAVSGAEEQLGDAALLVDPRRPDEIAQAVRRLYDSPALRQELVERGRRRAERFRSADFVRGVFQLLDEFEPVRRCWGREVS